MPEDDPYWINYLLLLEITDIVLAPFCTRGIIAHLRELISEHHSSFVKLYPNRPLTPKMHYLVDIDVCNDYCESASVDCYIDNFFRCGPVRRVWSMR